MNWIKQHKTPLFYAALGGWAIYWLFFANTGHACANTPTWLDVVFWAILGGMLLFMAYLMWGMRGFPERLYLYEEADQEAIAEARQLLEDNAHRVSDMDDFLRVANALPTFGEPQK